MMHAKQQALLSARAAFCAVFLLSSSGCALLANLSGPNDDGVEVRAPGSRIPDPAIEPSQGPSGGSAACSADLVNDSSNCGFCSHACGGADCRGGLCVPTAITTATDVVSLALDGDHVFYATQHDVRSCPTNAAATSASIADPAVVAAAVKKWGGNNDNNNNGVSVSTKGGVDVFQNSERSSGNNNNSGPPLPLQPHALALFSDQFFVADGTNGTVFSCPKAGCASSSIGTVRTPSKPVFSGGLTVSATSILWGEQDGLGSSRLPSQGTYVNSDGGLFRDTLTRGITHIELSTPGRDDVFYRSPAGVFALPFGQDAFPSAILAGSNVSDFAFNTHFAYVATTRSVVRVQPTTLDRLALPDLTGEDLALIVSDPAGVYATTIGASGQRLVRVRQDGVDVLATAPIISAIALTDTWLYFTGNGLIQRVAR